MTQKNYFLLAKALGAMAVALQRHEGVNSFNLLLFELSGIGSG